MRRSIVPGITLLCWTVSAAGPAGAVDRVGLLPFAGLTRSYVIHVPDGTPPRNGFPVLLAFHGGGMQGQGMRRISGLDRVADQRRLVVLYPDGIDRHWNDGRATIADLQDDVGFVSALLDQVGRDERVDMRRVFATGLSNGALFAERLACDLSRRISGIAAVAGTMPADLEPRCLPARPVAVLQVDGTEDPIMPYDGGTVRDVGGRGEGGRVLSVAATASFWAGRDGCGSPLASQPLAPLALGDPTRILRVVYAACPPAGPVTILSVIGGGHVWPGGSQAYRPGLTGQPSRQIDASAAIADFLLSLPALPG